jgi:hypothetical protein
LVIAPEAMVLRWNFLAKNFHEHHQDEDEGTSIPQSIFGRSHLTGKIIKQLLTTVEGGQKPLGGLRRQGKLRRKSVRWFLD